MFSLTGNVLCDIKGCWWDAIILNTKNSFCEELEHVFDLSLRYYMKT
jgi:hypothetical protein